ncbi:hypothetical protein ACFJGV_15335 [Cnuibacter sp. UC19_7]|uniref:SbtR family transcriptional regulator n=1 Tax=Cnuibacter sp. UC19_7 TaxID=3350166 RepID=UPI00366AC4C6
MDACVDAADDLAATHPASEALDLWVIRYTQFVATKRGLSAALHSGDAAYEPLAVYFSTRLAPTFARLAAAARAAGDPVADVDPEELLGAVSHLCSGGANQDAAASGRAERMVRLLLAGLRAPAAPRAS